MQIQVSLTIEIEANAGILEMEDQIQKAGHQAMRQAMKQAIRQWEEEHQECAHCGQKQRRLEGAMRRVLSTRFGRVQVPRRRFRCPSCGRRSCPANHLFARLLEAASCTICSYIQITTSLSSSVRPASNSLS